jgi:nicotinate phosphoribosyltransferase
MGMDCERTIANIRQCLTEYLQKWDLKALVIGISGGIDSALTALLAEPVCQELGIALIGISMPIESNKPEEIARAFALGTSTNMIFREIDLTAQYRADQVWVRGLEDLDQWISSGEFPVPDLTDKAEHIRNGNIKARLRMITLFNLANAFHGMVLSTDNYTELMQGFWTVAGDIGNYGMIQNLWKTEVYELAQYLANEFIANGETTKADALQACIDAPSTDGLGVSTTTLEQLGAPTFAEVERQLKDYLCDHLKVQDLLADMPKEHPWIITSLLDSDYYKYSMAQMIFHQYMWVNTEFAFKCRNKEAIDWRPLVDEINAEVGHLCTLRFTEDELTWLSTIRYRNNTVLCFQPDFIDMLRLLQLNRNHIQIWCEGPDLQVRIKGGWFFTTWFEIPVLAIINEIYFRHLSPKLDFDGGFQRLVDKIDLVKDVPDFKVSDFGTRRRRSKDWQRIVLTIMRNELSPAQFSGTSNPMFAKELGIKFIGTMAHEVCQSMERIYPVDRCQIGMMESWVKEYKGILGIALTDTIGLDAFLVDFNLGYQLQFDGVRIDSGDPFESGDKVIAHYQASGVDPMTKSIIFSDNLTFPKALEILEYFQGRTNVSFGIGTNLMNDFPDAAPLNIVIKMVECNNLPVAKISDTPEKCMCRDPKFIDDLRSLFDQKIRMARA